ncbi:efflux RND transporter permease subunit [Leptolyngbya sp. FACHB-541]|uniref:efflux RND transporter permease subunit n=1 Tax=Leptolyngbya sp. FACHB-541 TaxID=2692810 RepID=UPI0016830E92|nr:efflux RND transporter permease subunit [Leptolyngbya sp. FACHB-541]MBD2000677.1 efflux RND transporter permease subunit [Leptolyngbya sp. FACHB-541]
MFVDFFIKRPVFATVCAIIILLAGAISIPTLPIAQYPEIAPPQVTVTSIYTGADAETVESSVTSILEREINGVQGLRYMSSSSSNTGTSTITVTFDSSRDIDIAAVDVQNRVSVAQPQLPESVQRTGVVVNKESSNFLLAIGVFTEDDRYDPLFLSNYTDLYLVDAIKRIRGVGNVQIFGERQYAMRLWLDPTRLASRNLTPQDVVDAINSQNLQVGIGRIGQQPAPDEQLYQLDLRTQSRLTDPAQFEELVLRTEDDGTLIKFRDVGRVELGAEDYNSFLRYRGREAIGLGVTQLPGSNAIEVATAVKAEMARLAETFPPGLEYRVAFDTTSFVEASLEEVLVTLFIAVGLVILIIFIFLQDWRTTLIPSITIPVALIGTFIFVKAFGFSINTLTLFGLTLASGMVVDDAIVVVEDISRLIQQEGMSPRQAASASMHELTGAVIATSLVLMAVFVPVAFFPGTTGALYRQFALTIAFSILVSTFLALTLTPSLSALLLRRGQSPSGWLGWGFERFNRFLDWTRRGYERSLNKLVQLKAIIVIVFVALIGLTAFVYTLVPTGFLPEEDQGYFITVVQAPEGVSLSYTDEVMQGIEEELIALPEGLGVFSVGGFSLGSGNTANSGVIFTTLQPWEDRRELSQTVQGIIGGLFGKFSQIAEARAFPINPPPIQGLGTYGGFTFQLQDRGSNNDLNALLQSFGQLLGAANQDPGLQNVFSTYAAATPQLLVEVNRDATEALGISVEDVYNTMQTAIGSQYVNDFVLGRRNYRVYVQADEQFRSKPEDIGQLYVRSARDEMIPLSNLVTLTPQTGAQTINHYNLYRSIEITGSPAPGYSSGDAIEHMEQVAAQVLPPNLSYEWSGTSLEEIQSGGQAPLIFGLGLLLVFLVLSAQYENYIDPLIIMLAVPLAILGALSAQLLRGLENDVYCQVGLVMLIGLASKNSILIVEFANQLRETGLSVTKAAVEASQQRLRPILMTAISTLVGIFPLAIATGAGAGSRQSLGTAVFGGMLVATFLSLFIVPILYIVVTSLRMRVQKRIRSSVTSD